MFYKHNLALSGSYNIFKGIDNMFLFHKFIKTFIVSQIKVLIMVNIKRDLKNAVKRVAEFAYVTTFTTYQKRVQNGCVNILIKAI